MSKFKMKSKATKAAAKKATERGAGFRSLKIDVNKLVTRLLILGPTSDDRPAVFHAKVHELWANGKPISFSGTPSVDKKGETTGEKDKIVDTGWKLMNKYKESENKKKKDLFKLFLLKTKNVVNVLDLDNLEAGPMTYIMPNSVSDVVLDEFKEVGDDISSICDFDEGRVLKVKHNGKKKLERKYTTVKFTKPANLIEDGLLDEETIEGFADSLYDLFKMQTAYNEEAFEKHFKILTKSAKALGVDMENISSEEEEELEESDEYEDDEYEDDEDLIDDEEEEEDEDELIDDDEDLDEDLDEDEDEEEIELEDDEEEEEEEPPKKKKSSKKKKKKKKKSKK